MNELKPLGIYVHIPFCRSKCEYCDFYSIGGSRDKRLVDDYLQALNVHFKETGPRAADYVVDTVYFGGGTPSYFGADGLRRIFAEIQHRFRAGAHVRDFDVSQSAVGREFGDIVINGTVFLRVIPVRCDSSIGAFHIHREPSLLRALA